MSLSAAYCPDRCTREDYASACLFDALALVPAKSRDRARKHARSGPRNVAGARIAGAGTAPCKVAGPRIEAASGYLRRPPGLGVASGSLFESMALEVGRTRQPRRVSHGPPVAALPLPLLGKAKGTPCEYDQGACSARSNTSTTSTVSPVSSVAGACSVNVSANTTVGALPDMLE
mmetsp:Transcript_69612/g.148917  ORF Transcript_69612/g.148917 Transcript_69612/m.148917 type:complete len:175 (+) Transcript_69612:103-627(+)